jgi:hypothetical protein
MLMASTIVLITGVLTAGGALAMLPPPDPSSTVQAPQVPTHAAAGADHTALWALLASVALVAFIGLVVSLVVKTTRRRHHTAAV